MSKETDKLKQNLEDQLRRLVHQLADLEECKDDLEADEYQTSRDDTLEQLKDFNARLSKISSGDVSLDDELAQLQARTKAAISEAFKTPAVIKMFANREPDALRERLSEIDRDCKLGKSTRDQEKLEVLRALRHLNEHLTSEQLKIVMDNETKCSALPFDNLKTS